MIKKIKKLCDDTGSVDFILLSTILLLVSIGVIMVFSASSYISLHSKIYGNNQMYFFLRQGSFAVVGIIMMFFVSRINYKKYKKKKFLLWGMGITAVSLIAALFFPEINGARRWVRLGPLGFQPSELAKYIVVFFSAASIARKGEKMKSFTYGVLPYLAVAGAFAGLVLLGKNLSIATIILGTTIIMLIVGGIKIAHIALLGVGAIGFGTFFILVEPYRIARVMFFLDPFKDPQGKGYQLIQSWFALSSGGVIGQGLGQSRQKAFFLPEPHNDFIFAIIGEEFGFIGCFLLILLIILLLTRGLKVALNAEDIHGMLLALGITCVLGLQAIINIAVVSGAMPVTGVPLPFISYGGTALMINLFAAGVLLNISIHSKKRKISKKK